LTLAALMLYLMLRHAGRTSDVAADDLAEEELRAFATQRRSAVLLQASATVVGAFLPLLAVVFYLVLAIFYVIDPVRLMRTRSLGRARLAGKSAENLREGQKPGNTACSCGRVTFSARSSPEATVDSSTRP